MTRRYQNIEQARSRPDLKAEVKTIAGAPRLFVNGQETFPLLAWSWGLEPSAYYFKRSGIRILHPILGLNEIWPEPDRFNWGLFERHFDALLAEHPEAYFLPRVLLDVPGWWKERYPGELVQTAIPAQPKNPRQYRPIRINPEGGMAWGIPLRDASLASDQWRSDMTDVFRAFLDFVESSPLAKCIIGYQIGAGIYGEWHYPVAEFLPDASPVAEAKTGPSPSAEQRLTTSHGLLRDPVKEKQVVSYYEALHGSVITDALLHFSSVAKEATDRRVIVGAFQTYLLENVWIQEGGHLAPRAILESPDIDFIAGPYSYQTTNQPDREWYEHDVFDDGGNYLGRSRGVGGDGGYRVLFESLRRAGKLYFVEIDPSTYLEPDPKIAPDDDIVRELPLMGGEGSTTPRGTRDVLRRDIGRVLVGGSGGWLFDFGPTMATRRSWYADEPIIKVVRDLVASGEGRPGTDLSSVAQIAAIYDYRTFFYTRHWLAEAPFRRGSVNLDFVSSHFLTSQSRVIHRVGAPVDFLFHFDLTKQDLERYRLILVPNLFYLTGAELAGLRSKLEGSGATVVWYYAPGLIGDEGLDISRTAGLTGMNLRLDHEPASMMIDSQLDPDEQIFGADRSDSPRIVVEDNEAQTLGTWSGSDDVAFARKETGGFSSVFCGCGPIPVQTLRRLCVEAGARLWSTAPDVVVASEDWAMVVATTDGPRFIELHKTLRSLDDGSETSSFHTHVHRGEVRIFGPPDK